ncbi:HAMP domain-containing sensor histidine kinase, partial [Halomonas vilamensis]
MTQFSVWRKRWATRAIATRLLLAAVLIIGLALPLAGGVLSLHYRDAATRAFEERLQAILNVVIAGVAYDRVSDELRIDSVLGDSRFKQVFSGWYWQIRHEAGQTLTSRSLWDQRLPVHEDDGLAVHTLDGPRGQSLRMVERDIRLAALDAPLHVSVAGEESALDADIHAFQRLLWGGLFVLGVLLLGVLALQIRWGLAPLRRLRSRLDAIEQGEAQTLPTDFPEELRTLATGMNAVLARDQRLIERGRHAAGNLAHALKTPLSVMRLNVHQLPTQMRPTWEAELNRLDNAVRHHLARASAVGEGARMAPIGLEATLSPLLAGLSRLAQRRGLVLEVDWGPSPRVHVDVQDIQELVGNLLDNALRWAQHTVKLRVAQDGDRLSLT